MQQAYVSESNQYGTWTLIGYKAPQGGETTNFEYKDGVTAATTSAIDPGWTAENKVNLNDCDKGNKWTVTGNAITDGAGDVYTASAGTDADCIALTPSFDKIGDYQSAAGGAGAGDQGGD